MARTQPAEPAPTITWLKSEDFGDEEERNAEMTISDMAIYEKWLMCF